VEAGDEPFLMACRLKNVPIIKGGNRYESAMFAINELSVPSAPDGKPLLFILDDGFQHWGLYRDKDIVLIDIGNPFGNGMMLPFGGLREPLQAIVRADIIVLSKYAENKSQNNTNEDNIAVKIKQFNPYAPVFFASHKPVSCRLLSGEKKYLGWLEGKRIFGVCALGRPESFRKTILSMGAELTGFRAFRDHYKYTQKDILNIITEADASGADWLAFTEKDIIKLMDFNLPGNILIIEIEFSVSTGFYDAVFNE
jgi:tetraacyldisaccharide 4'-kinase